ncbi:MAG TPA: pyrroloquinoline quinone-dependent dehydrogenase [Puia sp.]|nr:pyrroloquinoline quinone-dependent dehydrogenase [Puia sp.]
MRLPFILLSLLAPGFLGAQTWSFYGQDPGGKRYSPLSRINDRNVSRLVPAWTFRTGELVTYAGTGAMDKAAFEATPILVGRTLYFSTPSDRVFAVDAETGKQHWVYDPKVDLHAGYSEISNRGVAAWGHGDSLRLFIGTIDGRLIAIGGSNGKPVRNFGLDGVVNLRDGYGEEVQETSPPVIVGDLVIAGSSMGDNQRFNQPPGVVRAYDVHTGKLRWSWDPVTKDPSDSGYATWMGPHAHESGAANAWSILSADPARDMVFVPTTCPSPDYYGGERLGANLYANSLVALRASTGKRIWSFQVVHHDIWDFDIAAQPVLIRFAGLPAVVIGTKMGFIYVLDRLTGKPLLPVEERPVPASAVAGEQAWPTQPFPVRPAPLGLQGMSVDSAWGPDPEELREARDRIAKFRYEGPFTPPSPEGTIMAPGNVGGIHWGGMCYDPSTGMLYTNINRVAAVIRMIPRDRVDSIGRSDGEVLRAETGRQRGTPYVMKRDYLFKADSRGFVMQTRPPWGTLVGIDLRTGDKKWEVPLGYQLDPARYPDAKKWGSVNFGGAIVTCGHLVFIAASVDGHFRAFDSRTGDVRWEYALPASAQATPMTYELGGRQYVVICAGGHGKLHTREGDYVMAFALP